MIQKRLTGVTSAFLVILAGCLLVRAQEKKVEDSERAVKENEVPAAALATLKKLAGAAAITEFAEEIEHGNKFYEGSWKGPDGNVDALVTEAGDLVETEEVIPAERVPAKARAEAEKDAGKEAKLMWEKKTLVLYEVHFKKDGKGREIILTPDGRRYYEEGDEKADKDDGDEDK